jgi:hypothetical protein
MEYVGKSQALSSAGLAAAAQSLGVKAPEIWALVAVETSGCGMLPDRRPQILYERHIFSRLTGGQYDDGDISDPTPGGYGPSGAPQYDRLARAVALDRESALKSTSWGLGQVMGENYASSGFGSVDDMVAAMVDSEDAQLATVCQFILHNKLDNYLQVHDWTSFASKYNGPSYAKNSYDSKLRGEYGKYSVGALPDLDVRAAQLYLTFAGYHPGGVDGLMGSRTTAAVNEFQQDQGLSVTGIVDDDLVAAIYAVATAQPAAASGASAG